MNVNDDGVTWPASANATVIVTSGYGPRNIGVGSRWHVGVDLVIQGDGQRVRSVAGGDVVQVNNDGDGGGFGNFVLVRTATGHLEMYNHLASTAVRVGDVIRPGQEVGVMGATGKGTGPHLDFRVFAPGTHVEKAYDGGDYRQVAINPIQYLRDVVGSEQQPLGVGAPPAQAPQGTTIEQTPNSWGDLADLYSDWIVGPGVAAQPSQVYNNAQPVVNGRASIARGDYPEANNIEHNYGYEALRKDPEFRMALVRVANKHNIPAQWLADVIEFESGFNVRAGENTWRSGRSGIGLIQFFRGAGLTDVARAMGVPSDEAAAQRLMNMTPAEQMEWVDFYLSSPQWDKGFRTVEDLLIAIFGGKENYDLPVHRRGRIRDININFASYMARLGNNAGRRYQTTFDNAVGGYHYQQVNGCPTCNMMVQSQGIVTAHRGGR